MKTALFSKYIGRLNKTTNHYKSFRTTEFKLQNAATLKAILMQIKIHIETCGGLTGCLENNIY